MGITADAYRIVDAPAKVCTASVCILVFPIINHLIIEVLLLIKLCFCFCLWQR